MKTYFTLGQVHKHTVLDKEGNSVEIDKDTIVVIEAESEMVARERMFELCGAKWCFSYAEDSWREPDMLHYFPKGYVYVR